LTSIFSKPNAPCTLRRRTDERSISLGDLLLGAEDVRVVLAERAHAREPVHDAAALVAVQAPEVGHAPGSSR
jgi:hypothetical protein